MRPKRTRGGTSSTTSPVEGEGRRYGFVISDKLVAVLGVALCLGLMVPLMITSVGAMFVLPAILTTVLCVIWMLTRGGNYGRVDPASSRRGQLVLSIAFFSLTTLIILIINGRPDQYERPASAIIALAFLPAILTLQALWSDHRAIPLILVQCIIYAVMLSWSMMALFPNVIGIDPWTHQFVTTLIIDIDHVPADQGYSGIPLFHILLDSSWIITGSSYKLASMLVMVVGQLTCIVLFVFLIAARVFDNVKIALLSAVVVTFATMNIHMSYEPTPTTLAFILVLPVLYLIVRDSRLTLRVLGIAILFLTAITLTHSVTAICMFLSLLVAYVVLRLKWLVPRISMPLPTATLILFFLVLTMGWWVYVANLLPQIVDLFSAGFSNDYFGVASLPGTQVPVIETVMKWAGMMIFFSLSIFAVLHSISRRGNLRAIYISVLGMLFLAMGILALTANLGLLEDRWWFYAQVVLAVPLGATLFFIGTAMYRRKTRRHIIQATLALGVAAIAFLSIISPSANIDNPLGFPTSGIRYAFTQSELQGAAYASQVMTNKTLSSDGDFLVNPSSSVFINYFRVDRDRLSSLDMQLMYGNFTVDGQAKIIRTVIFDKPLRLNGAVYRLDYNLTSRLASSGLDKVYVDGGIEIYV